MISIGGDFVVGGCNILQQVDFLEANGAFGSLDVYSYDYINYRNVYTKKSRYLLEEWDLHLVGNTYRRTIGLPSFSRVQGVTSIMIKFMMNLKSISEWVFLLGSGFESYLKRTLNEKNHSYC